MKGFPNQVADLGKLAKAMRCVVQLSDRGEQARDDGVLGPALVRAGVAGTGHTPIPVERYLREQLRKNPSNQSFRTTARGLRELFRLLGFIDDSGDAVVLTDLGRQAADFADMPMTADQTDFWRRAIRDMTHVGPDDTASHPYQVLLRLVARKPGITRAKCALALEARDDSPEELDRIVALADLDEEDIWAQIGVTKPNWDNAKKVLPKFAEQLRDVIRTGHSFVIADAPGRADVGPAETPSRFRGKVPAVAVPRAPRTSRTVTPDTIGEAGTLEGFDEAEAPPAVDPVAAAAAIRTRRDRLRRHNLLVKKLATRLATAGARLYELPFDVLGIIGETGILGEIKTLDGTPEDERDRVRESLSQLLYYEAFLIGPVAGEASICKVACFESRVTPAHSEWLNRQGIAVVWQEGDGFAGDALATEVLGRFLGELR